MFKRTHTFYVEANTHHIIDLEDDEWLDKVTYTSRAEGKLQIEFDIRSGFIREVHVTNNDTKQRHKITLWIHRPKPDLYKEF